MPDTGQQPYDGRKIQAIKGGSVVSIGDRLNQAMHTVGFGSQSELARVSGVPQPTIARILKSTGKSGPETETIRKLAAACRVSEQWLRNGTDSPAQNALSADQIEWLRLLNLLSDDDIAEFKSLICARQLRNKRLLAKFGADDLRSGTLPNHGAIPEPMSESIVANAGRYEKVRKLTPHEFQQIYASNIAGKGTFDDLIDALTPNPTQRP